MRPITAALLATLILAACGCVMPWMRHDDTGATRRDPPPVGRAPDAASLVNYLNENADRMQGIRAEVAMDCKQDRTTVGIDASMACARPRNFRLKGFAVGQPVVDIGSNDTEFWYWISKAPQPYVYHCSYADLSRGGVRLPFPFQPDMVVTALGMAKYDPAKNYRVKESAKYLELIEDGVTPDGQQVDKVTVFNRLEVRRTEPQVVGYALKTKQGHTLAYASIQRVSYDQASGAIVPQQVALVWPDQKLQMDMRLKDIRVTGFDPRKAEDLFSRRDLGRIQSFDLARNAPDGGAVQPAGFR
jgi:hypothetical protein